MASHNLDQMANLDLVTPSNGSVFYARATHLVDPHDFYVMPLKNEKLLHHVQKPGTQCSPSELKLGTIVVYYKPDRGYLRGVIKGISDDFNYKIFSMDQGNMENKVDITNIYHPLEHHTVPLALHCKLFQCEPKGSAFNESAKNAFIHYMGVPNEKLKIHVRFVTQLKLHVTVYNSNPDDVATLLALTEYTQFYKDVLPSTRIKLVPPTNNFPWKHNTLKQGETFRVRIQDGKTFSNFFVCTISDYKNYLQNRTDFTAYCRDQKEITEQEFKVGTSVGVLMDHYVMYERAVIEEVVEDFSKARVRLMDWGSLIVVDKHRIKVIKTELFSMTPVRAYFCQAVCGHGQKQSSFVKGQVYDMTVLEVGHEFIKPYMVNLTLVH